MQRPPRIPIDTSSPQAIYLWLLGACIFVIGLLFQISGLATVNDTRERVVRLETLQAAIQNDLRDIKATLKLAPWSSQVTR